MIARGMMLAVALAAIPAAASTPAAWSAQERLARARCAKASGLVGATAFAPTVFSDAAGVDVLRVTGRIAARRANGRTITMLCLFARRTGTVEVQEVPAGG